MRELQDPTIDFFDKMVFSNEFVNDRAAPISDQSGTDLLDQLISNEENYIANVLLKCLKLCPNSFGKLKFVSYILKDNNMFSFS